MIRVATSRNYKAEYERRIANAVKRGLSRSQARGHARAYEKSVRAKPAQSDTRLERALREMRKHGSQATAAREAGVSPERLRRFLRENTLASRKGREWTFTDNRLREMASFTDGRAVQLKLRGFDPASLNGAYLEAVERFLATNDYSFIEPFVGKSVRDAKGKRHVFETNPNQLYRLTSGDDPFEQIYRFVN